ncbi:hypothetical protein J6S37_00705 [Candidatus Saccharibacteria bacterium]|nr:hypothetical protein [Candidatus Saccharibacteria bacterium]
MVFSTVLAACVFALIFGLMFLANKDENGRFVTESDFVMSLLLGALSWLIAYVVSTREVASEFRQLVPVFIIVAISMMAFIFIVWRHTRFSNKGIEFVVATIISIMLLFAFGLLALLAVINGIL